MSNVKLDKVVVSSLHPAYINYATLSDDIVISATSLANGATRTISVTIPYDRAGTVADIYATRSTVKTAVSCGGRAAASAVYNFKSTETARFDVRYSSSNITVSLVIFNGTGGAITPNAQTITISVVQYDAPISDL